MLLISTAATAVMVAITAVDGQVNVIPQTLSYSVTYRDFLPSHCMSQTAFVEAWDGDSVGFKYTGIPDDWYETKDSLINEFINTNPSAPKSGILSLRGIYPPAVLNQLNISEYCPYWTAMRAGNISGHPDFEAPNNAKDLDSTILQGVIQFGLANCTVGGVEQNCDSLNKMVSTHQVMDRSGLPKIQFCTQNATERCGKSTSGNLYGLSKKGYFDVWYNDDEKFNKRVGGKLPFKKVSSDVDDFVVSFASSSFFPLNTFRENITEAAIPDYRQAPVWPNSFAPLESTSYAEKGSKFWFTTEIHTYFQYRGNEVFSFSGDDDVWVFINDKLAVDVGGVHAEKIQSISLSSYQHESALNLTVGGIYSFDMYHAERHYSQSNFMMTTSLVAACNVVFSKNAKIDFKESSKADFYIGRDSSVEPGQKIILTSTAGSSPMSSTYLFLNQQQNVGTGFVASFTFTISPENVHEGFAFVFHNREDGLVNFPIGISKELGFKNLENSVAIAFDLCADRNTGSCNEQRISLHYSSDGPGSLNSASESTRAAWDKIVRPLYFEEHQVRVEYLEKPDWLQVFIDDSLYLLAKDFRLETILGGRNAFVGFTASTSASPGQIEISDFSIETVSISPKNTDAPEFLLDSNSSLKELVADGISKVSFSIQTKDLCNNKLQYGGSSNLVDAKYVEMLPESSNFSARTETAANGTFYYNGALQPAVIPAKIIDHQNGTYSAQLQTTIPRQFALYLCMGLNCTIIVNFVNGTGAEGVLFAQVALSGDDLNNTFYGEILNAVNGVPPILTPTQPPTIPPTPGIVVEDSILKPALIIGGSVLIFLILAGMIALVKRRRWQRDKRFIDDGRVYRLENGVAYDKADDYGAVGRQLLVTREAILRERSEKVKDAKDAEIHGLVLENEELKEQVRLNKKFNQEAEETASAQTPKGKTLGPVDTRKKEFPIVGNQLY